MKKSLKKSLDKVIKNHAETFKKLAKNDTQETYSSKLLNKLPKPKEPTITWVAMFPDFQDLTLGSIMDASKVPEVVSNTNAVFDVMKVDEYKAEVWKLLGIIENLKSQVAMHEEYHRNR